MTARHFLKRDFLDFRLYWIILGIITAFYIFTYGVVRHSWLGLEWLFWAYFMFAIIPVNYILGSVWRTQHQLSRHYLLALPINHKRLFALQHLRILIFWFPLLSLGSLYPFLSGMSSSFAWNAWLLYYMGLLTTAGLYLEYFIWSTVEWEEISRYLPKGARFGAYLKLFVVPWAIFFLLLLPAWVSLLLSTIPSLTDSLLGIGSPSPWIVFLIGVIVLIIWIPRNARKWCVSLSALVQFHAEI
jgi:hypothetical protein